MINSDLMLSAQESEDVSWYLGLDLGPMGLAAVLCDRNQGQEYPLYWSALRTAESEEGEFFFPLRAYFAPKTPGQKKQTVVVGPAAEVSLAEGEGVFVEDLKRYLSYGLPFYSRRSKGWQPIMVGARGKELPLYWIQRALQTILMTLTPGGSRYLYRVGAVGLSRNALSEALLALDGVIVNCPAAWSDTYRFNVREAILGAKLVTSEEQIFFLEEAIAVLLGAYHTGESGLQVKKDTPTILLHGEGTITELGLVRWPRDLKYLSHQDFALRTLEYGTQAFYEDIFYQLIYPQWRTKQGFLDPLQLDCPQPGKPDRPKRDRAAVLLQQFPMGQSLLETAKRVWLILQKRESFTSKLGDEDWGVTREALVKTILDPWLGELNQRLNEILSEKGVTPDAIAQIYWSGETVPELLPFFQVWMSQKFPNAELKLLPTPEKTSAVAQGLAILPRFPQLLNRLRHQYNDYFLLWELLHSFPQHSVTLEQMLKLLEIRGINPRVCLWRIYAILEGYYPPGFVPPEAAYPWFAETSLENLEYKAIQAAPLFTQEGDRYRPNAQQGHRFRQYMALILARSQQTLADPLQLTINN